MNGSFHTRIGHSDLFCLPICVSVNGHKQNVWKLEKSMMYANIWISAFSNKSNMVIISEYTMRIQKIYANIRFEFIYDHVSGQFLHKKSEYDTQLRKYMHIFGLYSNMGMSARKVRIRFSDWENMCAMRIFGLT